MRRTLAIVLFGLLSTLVIAQSPTFDTVYLYRGGAIYYYHTNGDTVFINSDTIISSQFDASAIYDSLSVHLDTLQDHDIRINELANKITALYGVGIDSSLINTTIKFPIGYSTGIVVDTLVFIATTIGAGTVEITPIIYFGTNIENTGTYVANSLVSVTSHTTVIKDYILTNATIPEGNMIWLKFSIVTTVPRNFMVQIIGHRQ